MPEQKTTGFAATLKGKLGPLPVWGWLAIVTGLILVYYIWNLRKGASTGVTSAADVPQTVIQAPVTVNVPPEGPGPTNHKPGKDAFREVMAGGPHDKDDLQQIAREYGISEAQLIKLNPGLKKYEGSKHPIPRTRIKVPEKQAA